MALVKQLSLVQGLIHVGVHQQKPAVTNRYFVASWNTKLILLVINYLNVFEETFF
jgi:hypothetical protein